MSGLLGELAVKVVGMLVVFGVVLFFAAGTAAWLAGWTFLLLFSAFVIALSLWLYAHDPALLAERMTGLRSADRNPADRPLMLGIALLFFVWLVAMPLDAVRWRLSQVPPWLQIVGAAILMYSFYVMYLTYRENTYLSPAVRVQAERGQTVVSTGPYRYVRHPLYASFIVFVVGTSLLLGSWYGLLGVPLFMPALALRATLEEHMLQKALPGYADYMARVRYRFIPFFW